MYTLGQLRERLLQADTPIHTWGLPGTATKSLEDLYQEIREHSAFIPPTGPVICVRQSICLLAYYESTRKKHYRLEEVQQIFLSGGKRRKKKRHLPYLRETWRKGELPTETARRCFQEETDTPQEAMDEFFPLELFKQLMRGTYPVDPTPYTSETFPGLATVRTELFVGTNVPRPIWKRGGHEAKEGNIITVTKYKRILREEKPLTL